METTPLIEVEKKYKYFINKKLVIVNKITKYMSVKMLLSIEFT